MDQHKPHCGITLQHYCVSIEPMKTKHGEKILIKTAIKSWPPVNGVQDVFWVAIWCDPQSEDYGDMLPLIKPGCFFEVTGKLNLQRSTGKDGREYLNLNVTPTSLAVFDSPEQGEADLLQTAYKKPRPDLLKPVTPTDGFDDDIPF